MRFWEFIVEDAYDDAKIHYTTQIDNDESLSPEKKEEEKKLIDPLFSAYQQKARFKLIPPENGLNQITIVKKKLNWNQFKDFVNQLPASKTSLTSSKGAKGNAIILEENEDWLIVTPLDALASAHYGNNTNWCTTKMYNGMFANYFYVSKNVMVYCLNKKTGDKWGIVIRRNGDIREIRNRKDDSITEEDFESLTNRYFSYVVGLIDPYKNKIHQEQNAGYERYKDAEKLVGSRIQLTPEQEQQVLEFPTTLGIRYAHQTRGRWPALEQKCKLNADMALAYTFMVINRGKFKIEGLTEPEYVRISDEPIERWPEAEKIISSDKDAKLEYTKSFFPEEYRRELLITNDIDKITDYLRKNPNWQDGKQWIKDYGNNIVKSQDMDKIFEYLYRYKRSAWPEAEPLILKSQDIHEIFEYLQNFKRSAWPEAEPLILKSQDMNKIFEYLSRYKHSAWPEAEPLILKSQDIHEISWYLKKFNPNWREGKQWIKDYENNLLKSQDMYKIEWYIKYYNPDWEEGKQWIKDYENRNSRVEPDNE